MFADRKYQKCVRHVIRNIEEAVLLQEGRWGRGIVHATRLLQVFWDARASHRRLSRDDLTLEGYRGTGFAVEARITALLNRPPLQSTVSERLREGLFRHHGRGGPLRFFDDPSIPPTNSAAERDLRSGVSARKVSQCGRTQGGADGYAMIKSVVETAKRHNQHPLDVLVGLQVRAAPR